MPSHVMSCNGRHLGFNRTGNSAIRSTEPCPKTKHNGDGTTLTRDSDLKFSRWRPAAKLDLVQPLIDSIDPPSGNPYLQSNKKSIGPHVLEISFEDSKMAKV